MIAAMILLTGVGMGAVACATFPRSLLKRISDAIGIRLQEEAWVIDVSPSDYHDFVQQHGGVHR